MARHLSKEACQLIDSDAVQVPPNTRLEIEGVDGYLDDTYWFSHLGGFSILNRSGKFGAMEELLNYLLCANSLRYSTETWPTVAAVAAQPSAGFSARA